MTENNPPPESPLKLNRTRIIILVLGALALTFIIGSLMGGLENYQALRDARDAAVSSSSSASSAP